jgi:hypothetical protein
MLRPFRILYAITAWAFLVGLLGQVLLIGMYLFSDPSAVAAHRELGWILHLSPLLVLLFAALSRAGRRHWLWALALAIVVFIVPLLPGLRGSVPVAAAFHPVLAVTAAILAAVVAWNSLAALRMGDAPAPSGDAPAPSSGT